MREADVNRKSLIQTIADFVKKILPSNTLLSTGTPKRELPDFSPQPSKTISPAIRTDTDTVIASPSTPSTSREIIHETPKTLLVTGETEEGVGDEVEFTKQEVQQLGTRNFGELGLPLRETKCIKQGLSR